MNEFIEECRREWRRLGVPDSVANEMAADLTADLEEAEAEGGSAEDVLGNSAFDPRRFAGSWAVARGVTGPAPQEHRGFWRPPVAMAFTVLLGVITVGAAMVLLVGSRGHAFSVGFRRVAASPGPLRILAPGPGRTVVLPGPLNHPFMGIQTGGVNILSVAVLLLIVGIVGLGLLTVLYWSPWSVQRRGGRRGRGPGTPSWS